MGNKSGNEANSNDSANSGIKIREMYSSNLPNIYGPLNGYYYHKDDKAKAIENDKQNANHEIEVIFKYTGVDLENIQKQVNNNNNDDDKNNDDNDDKKDENKDYHDALSDNDNNDNSDLESLKEFQKTKFEWQYIVNNDNMPYRQISDTSYKISDKYEEIRFHLSKYDPIPPVFLRKAKMAGKVMSAVIGCRLEKMCKLKCRIIVKNVSESKLANIYHPALLLWDPKENFGEQSDDRGYIIHLIKLAKEFQTKQMIEQNKEEMEIECRSLLRKELDDNGWEYNKYDVQDLNLKNGLTSIGHWCLKYEMKNGYKYERYKSDCIQFMIELCNEFNITYSVKGWSNKAYEAGKVGNKICGSF